MDSAGREAAYKVMLVTPLHPPQTALPWDMCSVTQIIPNYFSLDAPLSNGVESIPKTNNS